MNRRFHQRLCLPISAEEAFSWHERPGALDRLIPPWENVAVQQRGDGVRDGSRVHLVQKLGPLKFSWIAAHHDYSPGRRFRDTQVSGPFAHWEHLHEFEQGDNGTDVLTDHIEYRLPGGAIGNLLGGNIVRRKVQAMFDYRHNTTREDLATHAKYADKRTLRFAVTGSSGLVGSTLLPLLTTGGHDVVRLVRDIPQQESALGPDVWDL